MLKKGMSCTQKGNDTPGEKPRAVFQVADRSIRSCTGKSRTSYTHMTLLGYLKSAKIKEGTL